MRTIMTLAAMLLRRWSAACGGSAAKWAEYQTAATTAATLASAGKPRDAAAGMRQRLAEMRHMTEADKAERKAERKAKRAAKLAEASVWLGKPWGVFGAILVDLLVPAALVGLVAAGVDLPALLTDLAEWVRSLPGRAQG